MVGAIAQSQCVQLSRHVGEAVPLALGDELLEIVVVLSDVRSAVAAEKVEHVPKQGAVAIYMVMPLHAFISSIRVNGRCSTLLRCQRLGLPPPPVTLLHLTLLVHSPIK